MAILKVTTSPQMAVTSPFTGTFTNGHATLTKQPVVQNGISGVNIIFELNFLGKGSTGTGSSPVSRLNGDSGPIPTTFSSFLPIRHLPGLT